MLIHNPHSIDKFAKMLPVFFWKNIVKKSLVQGRSLSSSTDSLRNPGISRIKIWQGNQLIFIPIPAEFRWGLDFAKTIPGISGTELVLGMAGMEYIFSKFNMSCDFSRDNAFMLQSP
jgi:hypothetical protein